MIGLVVADQVDQHRGEAEDGVGDLPRRGGQVGRQCEERPIRQRVPVDQHECGHRRSLAAGAGRAGSAHEAGGVRSPAMIRSATAFMVRRSFIAVRWMKAKASLSRQAVAVHQQALGPIDDLAGLELLLEALGLIGEGLHLMEATDGDLDGRHELAALERLDEIGQRPGVAGLLDEITLAERREDEHRSTALARDLAGRRQPVEAGHLDVEDGEVGLEGPDQLDRLVTPPGLPHDLVALLLEGLLQVEADDGLVLGDHDTDGHEREVTGPTPGLGPVPPAPRPSGAGFEELVEEFVLEHLEAGDLGEHVATVAAHGLGVARRLAMLAFGERRLGDQRPQSGVIGLVRELSQLLVGHGEISTKPLQLPGHVRQPPLDQGPTHDQRV